MKAAIFFCLLAGLSAAIAQQPPNPNPDDLRILCPHPQEAGPQIFEEQVREEGRAVEINIPREQVEDTPACVVIVQRNRERAAAVAIGLDERGGLGFRLVANEREPIDARVVGFAAERQ